MQWPQTLSDEHYQKLYRFQDKILTFLEGLGPVFYLGGGTALSRFHYNHRYSEDLYFFIFEDIDFIQSVQELHQKLADKGVHFKHSTIHRF